MRTGAILFTLLLPVGLIALARRGSKASPAVDTTLFRYRLANVSTDSESFTKNFDTASERAEQFRQSMIVSGLIISGSIVPTPNGLTLLAVVEGPTAPDLPEAYNIRAVSPKVVK